MSVGRLVPDGYALFGHHGLYPYVDPAIILAFMEPIVDITHELSRSWEKLELSYSIEDRRELLKWLAEAQDDTNLKGRTRTVVDLARV